MKYDFTSIMDRHGKDAIAVDMIGQPGGFAPAAPLPGFDPEKTAYLVDSFDTVPEVTADYDGGEGMPVLMIEQAAALGKQAELI